MEKSFPFSFEAAERSKKDLDLQIAAAEARMDRISNRIQFGGQPIISMLLHFSHDAEELRKLGKALERIADIVPELDKLRTRRAMVEDALTNPDHLRWLFGDFSVHEDDVDSFLKVLDSPKEAGQGDAD